MKLAQRMEGVVPSATLAITAKAKALRAEGQDVLALSAGEPDFDTPEHIKQAAREALDQGQTKYTPVPGTAALRQAIADRAAQTYGQSFESAQTIVCTGGKQVLFNACAALLNPGDEAIFGAPYWVSYPDMIRFFGGIPRPLETNATAHFLPQAEQIVQAITSRTRLLILNSPSNPTGAAYTEEALQSIAEVVRQHPQIAVISDDIYSELMYDRPFVGFAKVAPDLSERTLIATGVSKTYAMTGWRIGFGIGSTELIGAMSRLQGASTSGANAIAQAAAVAALRGDHKEITHMRDVFRARRDRIASALSSIPKVELTRPEGAFYVFPNIGAYLGARIKSSSELCEHLLETVKLAVVPGAAFGADNHLRLSYACSEEDIDAGAARLQEGLAQVA